MNIQYLMRHHQLDNAFTVAIYNKNDYLILACSPSDLKQMLFGGRYWTTDITKIESKASIISGLPVVHITVDHC